MVFVGSGAVAPEPAASVSLTSISDTEATLEITHSTVSFTVTTITANPADGVTYAPSPFPTDPATSLTVTASGLTPATLYAFEVEGLASSGGGVIGLIEDICSS